MKMKPRPESERLAFVLSIAHGTMKENMAIQRSLPEPLVQLAFHSDCGLSKGDMAAVALEIFVLYDRCAKAGLVDVSSVEASFLNEMRETIEHIKQEHPEAIMRFSSPEAALKEMIELMASIVNEFDRRKPKMPDASDVIEKARKQ